MSNRATVWMIAAVLGLAPHIAAGQEHAGHRVAGEPSPVDAAACERGAQQALPVIERARTRVETARQANSPPELRAAIDDLQSALSQLTAQLTPCAPPVSGAPRQGSGQALPMPQDHSNMTMPMDHSKMVMPPAAPKAETAKPSSGAAMPMDHSKMGMPSAVSKSETTKPRSGAAMPIDHSKMVMPPGTPKTETSTPSKGAVMPMDHSKMAMPPTTSNSETKKPSADAAPPMDHSKMATPPTTPQSSTDKPAATPGNAKLPVMPLERVLDPRCAKTIDLETAPRATFEGKVYYFCSTADRDRFRKNPAAYLKKPQ